MDSNEFFQGLHTEEQESTDSLAGMEHFIRLKKQVGLQNNAEAELEKEAFDINPSDRSDIPKGDFAQPHKEEAGHEGKYPIPDRQHARSALGFAKMHHDSAALAAVKHKVEEKYPDMLGHEKEASNPLLGMGGVGREAILAKRQQEKNACPTCGMGKEACMCGSKYASVGGGQLEFDQLGANNEGRPMDERLRSAYSRMTARMDKTAAKQKLANALTQAIKEINPVTATAVGLGAAAGGIGTYLSSRPRKELGGLSKAEEALAAQAAANEGRPEATGLRDEMGRHQTDLEHGYAQAFRKHPYSAAALGAATGAAGGYGLSRLAGAIARMRGGKV